MGAGTAGLCPEPSTYRLSSVSPSPKTSSLPPLPLPCGSSGMLVALCVLSLPGCWCFMRSSWSYLWCCCPPRIWLTALWTGPFSTLWPFLPLPLTSGPCALTPYVEFIWWSIYIHIKRQITNSPDAMQTKSWMMKLIILRILKYIASVYIPVYDGE